MVSQGNNLKEFSKALVSLSCNAKKIIGLRLVGCKPNRCRSCFSKVQVTGETSK